MSKYVEKEAAIDYLTLNMNWYDEDGGQVDDWDERKAIISDLLDGIPPADVKPVVRGKWLDGRCTNCAWELPDYEYCGGYEIGNVFCDEFNFCPNCGADMREANDE